LKTANDQIILRYIETAQPRLVNGRLWNKQLQYSL
jgi:hypothetical protein